MGSEYPFAAFLIYDIGNYFFIYGVVCLDEGDMKEGGSLV